MVMEVYQAVESLMAIISALAMAHTINLLCLIISIINFTFFAILATEKCKVFISRHETFCVRESFQIFHNENNDLGLH